jgi:hypothetical protein
MALRELSSLTPNYAYDRAARILKAVLDGGPVAPVDEACADLFKWERVLDHMPLAEAYAELSALEPRLTDLLEEAGTLGIGARIWRRHRRPAAPLRCGKEGGDEPARRAHRRWCRELGRGLRSVRHVATALLLARFGDRHRRIRRRPRRLRPDARESLDRRNGAYVAGRHAQPQLHLARARVSALRPGERRA